MCRNAENCGIMPRIVKAKQPRGEEGAGNDKKYRMLSRKERDSILLIMDNYIDRMGK